MKRFDYGKYRGIIISIALFLILDASVLMMNFYISFEIADDAVGVNIAGRQRMLSQRTMKSLLDIQTSLGNPEEVTRSTNELKATTQLFDQTLIAFDNGGTVMGTDGQPATLAAVTSQVSMDSIGSGKQLWQPYYNSIKSLLAIDYATSSTDFAQQLEQTVEYGQTSNLTLLTLMNNLTVDLEAVASSKASTLRLIQTVGISLAVLNFFIIMFHSIRQLRDSDRKIDAARQETRRILDTVNEGLFLLNQAGEIGTQQSAELEKILGKPNLGGLFINELMADLVSDKEMQTAQKFIGLLFDPKKKEKLLGSLNPLSEVEVHINREDGTYENKFLSFSFSRVMAGKEILQVLVTVTDVTRQVELERELESAKQLGEQQLEMLNTMIQSGSNMIPDFLNNSFKSFKKINAALKHGVKTRLQLIEKANYIYRLIHNFKGEAAALNLDQFVEMAHQFEDKIDAIKTKPNLEGGDFLPLAMSLDKLISQTEATQNLMQKISGLTTELGEKGLIEDTTRMDWSHLQQLADKVGGSENKQVEVMHSGLNDHDLPDEVRQTIKNVSIQLVRNAVAHGIENANARSSLNKPVVGQIHIRLTHRQNGEILYTFYDDGAGLDMEAIRRSAIEKGMLPESVDLFADKKQIISTIFEPDFSTKSEANEHAGRGMGMSSVSEAIKALGGKISVTSRRGKGSKFIVTLPPMKEAAVIAA